MKTIKRIDLNTADVAALLERVRARLGEEDYALVKTMAETIAYLTQAVEENKISASRLLKMVFGSASEKTKKVLKGAMRGEPAEEEANDQGGEGNSTGKESSRKGKGHGRTPAAAYTGAEVVEISHPSIKHGDLCPECPKGIVYRMKEPKRVIRITGSAPLIAKVYNLERLRCNLCGKIFTAPAPEGVGDERYDARAAVIIALLKYGSGFPFYRLAGLQKGFGVPIPPSVQWEIVEQISTVIFLVYDELLKYAAQGDLFHNDDTLAKILSLIGDTTPVKEGGKERKAVQTTGIVSVTNDRKTYLFSTGKKNAGENLDRLLAMRKSELDSPVLMCDGLPVNLPKEYSVIVANCLAHGRRNFVDVASIFPKEIEYFLKELGKVYEVDAFCRKLKMSPEDRLKEHRKSSKSIMEGLRKWLSQQEKNKAIEPNSSMGQAVSYMIKHWEELTLFLRVPCAPLDNNICERALKKAILHRKNSLFYKTEKGAQVGDMYMGMIHTARENGINPFEYLVTLIEKAEMVKKDPAAWLPWNYQSNNS